MFLLLLEFQAQDDRWMALRILTYSGLLYQELIRSRAPEVAGERLPAVLPVVLYNGTEPWTATSEVRGLIAPVGRWLAPYQPSQRYCLLDLRHLATEDLTYRNLLRAVARLEQSRTLEEATMTLVERVAEWPKQWLREGREQGVAEGREQGVAEGREQGRAQGVDQQRALLCRQAAARFDADTAARLADLLAPVADPERLAEVGDWLVRCDTAAEFLARVDSDAPA